MVVQTKTDTELAKISELIRDKGFTIAMSGTLDSNYQAHYDPSNLPPPAYDSISTKIKSLKDEKIAINLAGFYAVECGIGALRDMHGGTPVEWLNKIADRKLDSADLLILQRFANATWKIGQPFRSMDRITRDNFVPASFLPAEEVKKDDDQLVAAASKLRNDLKGVNPDSTTAQLQKINLLLRDKNYAFEMARHMDSSYYIGQNKPVQALLGPGEDTATILKSTGEEKVATSIAGFYALECGVNYLSTTQGKAPSEILRSIIADSIADKDKILLERFANATWKASQPFRGMDRLTRSTFVPFDFLPKEEVEKDWVQIKGAATKLIKYL